MKMPVNLQHLQHAENATKTEEKKTFSIALCGVRNSK